MTAINSGARANILAKLKAQVAGADYDKLPIETPVQYPEFSAEQLRQQFVSQLTANHAQVISITHQQLISTIAEQLAVRDIKQLLYGQYSQYSADIESLAGSVELLRYQSTIDDNKTWLFEQVPASICGAKCAIASTGSIVLWPTIEEPRTLSLVPPVHFVIVDIKTLYRDFATLVAEQQWQDKLPTNVVLVSGPSKTADIQQTLAYGAHGPKELIVLLLED